MPSRNQATIVSSPGVKASRVAHVLTVPSVATALYVNLPLVSKRLDHPRSLARCAPQSKKHSMEDGAEAMRTQWRTYFQPAPCRVSSRMKSRIAEARVRYQLSPAGLNAPE